jgi:hypothetical protein
MTTRHGEVLGCVQISVGDAAQVRTAEPVLSIGSHDVGAALTEAELR